MRNTALNCFSGMTDVTEEMIKSKIKDLEDNQEEQLLQTMMSQAFQRILFDAGGEGGGEAGKIKQTLISLNAPA